MSIDLKRRASDKHEGLPAFPNLMDGASAAIVQLDHEGKVQLWNHSAERLFGWRAAEVIGKPTPNVPNDLWEDNQAWFLRCLGGQTMSGVQLKRRRKDGNVIDVHAWAWPVRTEHGKIIGVMKLFFPVGERIRRDELPNQALADKHDQAQRLHKAILYLSKTDHPNLDAALQTLTTVASRTLQVERVSIWLFSEDRQSIRCMCLYLRTTDSFERGKALTAVDYPRYFAALEESRAIAASAARSDPRTSEYADLYLKPLGITSMLDVPIRLHGKEIGIVCHEHIGNERDWAPEEQSFAGTIADLVSLAFENNEHATAEKSLRESQATLQSFVESAAAGMGIATVLDDQDLQIIWGNTALNRLWPQLHNGANWLPLSAGLFEGKFILLWKSIAQQCMQERQSVRFEAYEHGTERWLDISLSPIPRQIGEKPRISFIIEDKTAYRQALISLKRSEELLNAVIDGSPVGIQVFDKEGVLRRQNPAMERLHAMLAWHPEVNQFNIKKPEPSFSAEDTVMAERAYAGEVVEHPFRHLPAKNDSSDAIVLDTIYYPVDGKENEASGIACFHRDISERRRLEEQLQQTQRLESLGLLAGTIAHDFNGLLTAIYGFVDLAQSELPTNHVARSYLQSSIQATLRATDLTQQLLAYAGKGKREVKEFDLSVLVLEVTEILKSLVHKSGKLEMQLSPSLPDIHGDTTQIRQVVMNLISNAAESQAVKSGTIHINTGTVHLSAEELLGFKIVANEAKPGEFVFLEVSDQGCGMTPEVRDRIFDPFFTTKSKGRGLGLAAVVGIIRGHKGILHLESVLGYGSTFTMYLPVPT
jgi:PAS domain S-box-containing protein